MGWMEKEIMGRASRHAIALLYVTRNGLSAPKPMPVVSPPYGSAQSQLHALSVQLALRPELYPLYNLRLLPLSLERSAILAQLENEERYAIQCAQTAYDEERERVEDEWKRGRDRVRERLLEGIEERRRKAREEKEGEGATGGALALASSHQRGRLTLTDFVLRCYPRCPLSTAANTETAQQVGDISPTNARSTCE
jgi:hypothetical protein